MLLRVEVSTHFKDHHPDRIDICALGGKLFQRRASEPKSAGVHQFWRHPPGSALYFTASGFLHNDRQPEVRYKGAVVRVYQDVGLGVTVGLGDMFATSKVLTPLISPWTIPCSCRNSNPVTAPTSYPNNQFTGKGNISPWLTRRRRLYFGLAVMKSTTFPLSISAETIEICRCACMTPTNGRIFLCCSHLQPTTSLARSLVSS